MNNILKKTSALLLGAVMLTGTANAKMINNKAGILPSYKINSNISISQLKLDKNTFVADYKYADVTGDKIKDSVITVGVKENKNDRYLKDISIIVQDGKTKKFSKASVGKNSGGYEAKMFLGDFNKDKISDVLVSMPTGGSGGIVEYGLISFKGNAPKALFNYEKFNEGLNLDVKFIPDFEVELKSNSLNKTDIIDVSDRKDYYIGSEVYDKDGKVKTETTGWVDGFSQLKPVDTDKDGVYDLVGSQSISGVAHVDRLGYFKTTWKWDGKTIKLDADNIKIEQVIDEKQADINGDGVKDYVRLTGMKNFGGNSLYMTDMNIHTYIENGDSTTVTEFPVAKINEGYIPSFFIGNFNGDKLEEMLVGIPCGGTGGFVSYSLISLKDDKVNHLLDQENFNRGLDFDVDFKDGFKVDITVKDINKIFSLDASASKDFYIEDRMYDKDGKLLTKTTGMNNSISQVDAIDVDKDGKYELVAYQRVCGIANADTIGYVKSTWKAENLGVKLIDVSVVKDIDK